MSNGISSRNNNTFEGFLEKNGHILELIGIFAAIAVIFSLEKMKIIAYDPFIKPELYGQMGVEPASLADLLSKADVVTLHVPLSSATEKLLDSRALASVKPGTILIERRSGSGLRRRATNTIRSWPGTSGEVMKIRSTAALRP
jgi:hypothetical protein